MTDFGLTGNQAKVYVAVVKLGVASASEIAQLSKVRREEVYRLMPKLQQLGLVEKILGKPIKYKSISPRKGLSILFERERKGAKKKIAELKEKRGRLFKQLKPVKARRTVVEEPRFVLISDKGQVLRKMVAMLQKAKKEVSIATSEYGFRLGYTYADALEKVLRKGVKVRIILEINEIDALMVKMLSELEIFKNVVEVKHVDNLASHIVIVDNAEVLVGTFLKPTMEKHVDLWTNNSAYVDAMKAFFDRIWQDSVDIKSRIANLQTGKPIERTEVVRGRDKIYEHLCTGLYKINSNFFMIGNGTAGELFERDFKSASMELKNRGVRVRLLTNINEDNLEIAEEHAKYFEVRHLDQIPMRAILGDEEIGFSWIPIKDMPEVAIYSNNPEIVHMIWEIAENAWNKAMDAQLRIDEIKKKKPIGRVSKPVMEYVSKNQKTRM